MLNGEPLREDASRRDFNGGVGCHVASALEGALLLPNDMVELRNIRKHEVFLNVKRYFGMAVQATFRLEEITNSCYQQLDDERKRRVAAVQSFNVADQSNADLRKKLAKEEKARKSADLALESAERQVED